jgi:hypothetical protein
LCLALGSFTLISTSIFLKCQRVLVSCISTIKQKNVRKTFQACSMRTHTFHPISYVEKPIM